MAVRTNDALAHKRLDATFNGAAGINFDSGTLEIRTGAQPATANAALTGTVLATVPIPADAFAAAAARAVAKAGTWQDTSADAAGTAGYFTMRDAASTYRIDGSVTATGGGGDMTVDNTNFAAAQPFTITALSVSE